MEYTVYMHSQVQVKVQVDEDDKTRFEEEYKDAGTRLVSLGGQKFDKHSIMMILDENAEVIINGDR